MRTSQNYQISNGLSIEGQSLTVPDQSLTLRELLVNYTRGQDLPYGKQQPAFFDEDVTIPDLKKMDLVDLQELAEGNAHKASELQKNLDSINRQKSEQELNLKVQQKIKDGGYIIPPKNSSDA